MSTLGGEQQMTIVSEAGLYRLIFKSRKKEAEQFMRWVCHSVLPAIRKTGAYMAPSITNEQLATLITNMETEIKRRIDAENKIGMLYEQVEKYARMTIPETPFGAESAAT